MRPVNSCCFSGGADGTQGSFKSMPGMEAHARRAISLIARICRADRPLATATGEAKNTLTKGTSTLLTTLRCSSSMGSVRAHTNIADWIYCCLKQNTKCQGSRVICRRLRSVADTALPQSKHLTCGTGFIRKGGIPDDENAVDVPASSRINPVPRILIGSNGWGVLISPKLLASGVPDTPLRQHVGAYPIIRLTINPDGTAPCCHSTHDCPCSRYPPPDSPHVRHRANGPPPDRLAGYCR
jgi:hypothetical protein